MDAGDAAGGAAPPDMSARAVAGVPDGGVGGALVRGLEELAQHDVGCRRGLSGEQCKPSELLGLIKERLAQAVGAEVCPARLVESEGLQHGVSRWGCNVRGHDQLVELVLEVKNSANFAGASLTRAAMAVGCALVSIALSLRCRLHDGARLWQQPGFRVLRVTSPRNFKSYRAIARDDRDGSSRNGSHA